MPTDLEIIADDGNLCGEGPLWAPDIDEIYVTSAAHSDALALAPEGYNPSAVFVGGPLYRFRCGIQGRAKFQSRISVPAYSGDSQ